MLEALIYKNENGKIKKTRIWSRKDGKEKRIEREDAWKRLSEIGLNPIQIISILGFSPKKK